MSNQDSETFSNYFFMSIKNSLMWRNTTSGITNGMISSLKWIVEHGDSELESTNPCSLFLCILEEYRNHCLVHFWPKSSLKTYPEVYLSVCILLYVYVSILPHKYPFCSIKKTPSMNPALFSELKSPLNLGNLLKKK